MPLPRWALLMEGGRQPAWQPDSLAGRDGRRENGEGCRRTGREVVCHASVYREPRGYQGMVVVSSNWFDCVLLSILYMFKPSC